MIKSQSDFTGWIETMLLVSLGEQSYVYYISEKVLHIIFSGLAPQSSTLFIIILLVVYEVCVYVDWTSLEKNVQ